MVTQITQGGKTVNFFTAITVHVTTYGWIVQIDKKKTISYLHVTTSFLPTQRLVFFWLFFLYSRFWYLSDQIWRQGLGSGTVLLDLSNTRFLIPLYFQEEIIFKNSHFEVGWWCCSDVDPGVRAELPVHLLGRPGAPHRHAHPLQQDVRYHIFHKYFGCFWLLSLFEKRIKWGTMFLYWEVFLSIILM